LLRHFGVFVDGLAQNFELVRALREQLLFGLYGLDQLGDFLFARLHAVARGFHLALGGDVLFGILGLRELVLGAGGRAFVGLKLALLIGVVVLRFCELGSLVFEQRLNPSEVALGGFELGGYRLECVGQFLNLGVESLKFLKTLKLIAQLFLLGFLGAAFPTREKGQSGRRC
jgi:hypothetical protein